MSTTGIPVDVDVLRSEIQKTYTEVSTEQDQDFIFPTGRGWAEECDPVFAQRTLPCSSCLSPN